MLSTVADEVNEGVVKEHTMADALDCRTWLEAADVSGANLPVLSAGGNIVLTAAVLLLTIICLVFSLNSGKMKNAGFGRAIVLILLLTIILFALGTLASFIVSIASGIEFSLFHPLHSITNVNLITIVMSSTVAILTVLLFFIRREKFASLNSSSSVRRSARTTGQIKFSFKVLYSSILVSLLLAAVSFFVWDSLYFLAVPVAISSLSLVLWRLIRWRGFLLAGVVTILFHTLIFSHCIASYVPSGSLPVILPFIMLSFLAMLSIGDLYCRNEKFI